MKTMKNLLNIANPSKASKMIVTALNLSAEASAVSEKLKFINCVTGCEARNFGTNYDLARTLSHVTPGEPMIESLQ